MHLTPSDKPFKERRRALGDLQLASKTQTAVLGENHMSGNSRQCLEMRVTFKQQQQQQQTGSQTYKCKELKFANINMS